MARTNNGSVSAYATFEAEKGVKGIGTFVPRELYAHMQTAMPDTSDGAIIKRALVELVNREMTARNPEIGPAWVNYELPENRKESAKAKAEREAREAKAKAEATAKQLEDALAQIAQLKAQLVPTPPAVVADARTGRVVAK